MIIILIVAAGLFTRVAGSHFGKIIELDGESFHSSVATSSGALVMFYATWCGYCREFVPTYVEIARILSNIEPDLIVGKIDGTRYTAETSWAAVRGYPTIILFREQKAYTFNGERSLDGILSFVKTALGPAVEVLSEEKNLMEKAEMHVDEVFFLYRGSPTGSIWNAFNETAEEFKMRFRFYHLQGIVSGFPEVYAYKDESRSQFSPTNDDLQTQIRAFVLHNQYPAFGERSVYEIKLMAAELASPDWIVCIFFVDQFTDASLRFKSVGRKLATGDAKTSLKNVKFVWTGDTAGLRSLALSALESPNIVLYLVANESLILHPQYASPETIASLDRSQLMQFLEDAVSGRIPKYGARSWITSIRRFSFNFLTAFSNFLEASPLLAITTFGIPLACLSCLGYCLCCGSMDALVQDVEDETEQEKDFTEARRHRLVDHTSTATYQDTVRARSIYKRSWERSGFEEDVGLSKSPQNFDEPRKDR